MIRKIFSLMILAAMILLTQNAFAAPNMTYQVHVQDKGWLSPVGNGEVTGSIGKGRRLEAIVIHLDNDIEYNAHVQNIGWQGWTRSGVVAGTIGEALRMEAIRIRLRGRLAERYDVYYRAYVQNIGWQDSVMNGGVAGTEGQALRIEAIQIELVRKGDGYGLDRHRRDYDRYGR